MEALSVSLLLFAITRYSLSTTLLRSRLLSLVVSNRGRAISAEQLTAVERLLLTLTDLGVRSFSPRFESVTYPTFRFRSSRTRSSAGYCPRRRHSPSPSSLSPPRSRRSSFPSFYVPLAATHYSNSPSPPSALPSSFPPSGPSSTNYSRSQSSLRTGKRRTGFSKKRDMPKLGSCAPIETRFPALRFEGSRWKRSTRRRSAPSVFRPLSIPTRPLRLSPPAPLLPTLSRSSALPVPLPSIPAVSCSGGSRNPPSNHRLASNSASLECSPPSTSTWDRQRNSRMSDKWVRPTKQCADGALTSSDTILIPLRPYRQSSAIWSSIFCGITVSRTASSSVRTGIIVSRLRLTERGSEGLGVAVMD